jgi:hypothetical protein
VIKDFVVIALLLAAGPTRVAAVPAGATGDGGAASGPADAGTSPGDAADSGSTAGGTGPSQHDEGAKARGEIVTIEKIDGKVERTITERRASGAAERAGTSDGGLGLLLTVILVVAISASLYAFVGRRSVGERTMQDLEDRFEARVTAIQEAVMSSHAERVAALVARALQPPEGASPAFAVDRVEPPSAPSGQEVTIRGRGLARVARVLFDGVEAPITGTAFDQSVTVKVPNGDPAKLVAVGVLGPTGEAAWLNRAFYRQP